MTPQQSHIKHINFQTQGTFNTTTEGCTHCFFRTGLPAPNISINYELLTHHHIT